MFDDAYVTDAMETAKLLGWPDLYAALANARILLIEHLQDVGR